jgi:hypothetical protein
LWLAGIGLLLLLVLLGWQFHRNRLMSICHEQGGEWNGASSSCRLPDGRIIIRPDLRRV